MKRWIPIFVVLALLLILPLFVKLTPFFCKYVCPAGTLSGALLAVSDALVRSRLGGLFTWKVFILALTVFASLKIWRPFCKYLCPLGAIYGFFNRVSLHALRLDASRCVRCGKCAEACRMCVDPAETPESMECIRCGKCVSVCPAGALSLGFSEKYAPEK